MSLPSTNPREIRPEESTRRETFLIFSTCTDEINDCGTLTSARVLIAGVHPNLSALTDITIK